MKIENIHRNEKTGYIDCNVSDCTEEEALNYFLTILRKRLGKRSE